MELGGWEEYRDGADGGLERPKETVTLTGETSFSDS